jgi:hypothetical protein
MKNKSKLAKRSGETLSFNTDREGSTWQEERGPRYGNILKTKAKQKPYERRWESI